MIKILVMVVRKPGLTKEQFRQLYESSHVVLAKRIFGDLFVEYRRNYPGPSTILSYTESTPLPSANESCGYDVITEVVLKDRDALDQMMAIIAKPEVRKLIIDDEMRIFDRDASRMMLCEVEQSGAHIQWPSGDFRQPIKVDTGLGKKWSKFLSGGRCNDYRNRLYLVKALETEGNA